MTQPQHRPIRSFVRREGRLTPGQQRALDELFPRYGLDLETDADALARLIAESSPVTLEIGFGDGESLLQQAAQDPGRCFVGIEVHRPGVGHMLRRIDENGLENVRVICADAIVVLGRHCPDASLDTVQLFFPDPWPKKRHHKRRIVQPSFVELVARKLRPGGHFHLATDWQPYAEWMLETMEASETFHNACGKGQYAPRPEHRPITKFERRGGRLGHGVWDLVYTRNAD